MKQKTYKAKLQHDNGIINITTHAKTEQAAIAKIIVSENCPRNAIKEIKQLNKTSVTNPGRPKKQGEVFKPFPIRLTQSTINFYIESAKAENLKPSTLIRTILEREAQR